MDGGDEDQQLPGGSLLRDLTHGFAAHADGGATAPLGDLLDAFDIPRADLVAWEATRNMWAGAPRTPRRVSTT